MYYRVIGYNPELKYPYLLSDGKQLSNISFIDMESHDPDKEITE